MKAENFRDREEEKGPAEETKRGQPMLSSDFINNNCQQEGFQSDEGGGPSCKGL